MSGRKGGRGWPLWEVGVAIAVAAGVLGVLRTRYELLLEQSEAQAVRLQLMEVGTALRLQQAKRLAGGQSVADLHQANPLDWLELPSDEKKRKSNSSEMTNLIKTGEWQYAADLAAIRYCPLRRRHLDAGGAECLVWQVQGEEQGSGLHLASLTPYKWF